jgi:hypothetical protein
VSAAIGPSPGARVAAMGIAVFCLAWLLVAGWGAAQYRRATHFGPVLYAPLSLAVDPVDGTIYCASGAGRIQKYGPDGRGRGAFPVENEGADFRIASDGPGLVAMAVEGRDRITVFDEGGRPVGEREAPGAWAAWSRSSLAVPSIEEGLEIALIGGAIVQRDPSGEGDVSVLVPAVEFPLSLFAAAPWLLVISLFCSTLGLMGAFIWPFLARPEDAPVR